MPAFKRNYEKLYHQHREVVDKAILAIVKNPSIGEEKKGDLTDIFVYKFKIPHQEFLLAYQWDALNRTLLVLGVHENSRILEKTS
jgi:mRNA-degrading endonuclease RelE of RelBE toxin-antitoxin system